MKLFRFWAICLMSAVLGFSFSAAALAQVVQDSPVGYWQTFEDKTGAPKSIVKIFMLHEKLYGRIMQINYAPGKGPKDLCVQCTGVRQTQPVLGMVFMWDVTKTPAEDNLWGDGQLLDPKTGNNYNVQLSLADHGSKLKVLGYMGSTLFGRTQTWQRLPNTALASFDKSLIASGSDIAALQAAQL